MSPSFHDLIGVIFIVTFLSLIPLGAVIFFVVLNRRNNNIYLKEKEIARQQNENQMLRSRIEIQELTLKTISQEIHDNLGQLLSLIKINLHTVIETKDDGSLDETYLLLSQVITDLRNLNKSFNPDHLAKEGVFSALEREIALINKSNKYKISFENSLEYDLSPEVNVVVLFRMIQEILQNVIKHAEASTIQIRAYHEKDEIILSVSDNGVGFDTAGSEAKRGMGLANLEERAKLLDAQLEIISQIGTGTEVLIKIKNEPGN